MTFDSDRVLDSVGWKLVVLLQEDARRSYSELGRIVGLSAPAVAERVRRLEEAGIITGYHAAVDPARLGLPIGAVMRLSGVGERIPQFTDLVMATPEVLECHRLTGNDSFVLRVVAASIGHLERLIDRFVPYGEVTTSLVLSSPVVVRVVQPPA
jgi:Lrp/AsnC family transcriptional regulator, leucine-responsive regulatory protein